MQNNYGLNRKQILLVNP